MLHRVSCDAHLIGQQICVHSSPDSRVTSRSRFLVFSGLACPLSSTRNQQASPWGSDLKHGQIKSWEAGRFYEVPPHPLTSSHSTCCCPLPSPLSSPARVSLSHPSRQQQLPARLSTPPSLLTTVRTLLSLPTRLSITPHTHLVCNRPARQVGTIPSIPLCRPPSQPSPGTKP